MPAYEEAIRNLGFDVPSDNIFAFDQSPYDYLNKDVDNSSIRSAFQ